MKNYKACHYELKGSSYEVGKSIGAMCLNIGTAKCQIDKINRFTKEESKQILSLFHQYCPGINEEISGFADALAIDDMQVVYYFMTYLKPGCSQLAVLPSKTKDGHILLARNYEFNDKMEDFALCTTKIDGKYAHIGSSVMQFGRNEGMNEHGLCVSQSSAGFPVTSNLENSRKPAIVGLQFWAVIRTLLENCKDVKEAVELAINLPIAYNINLLLGDKSGNAALLETLDGRKAVKYINSETEEQFICSTNHVHLEELIPYEPKSMHNSIIRYRLIHEYLGNKNEITKEDLKKLLSNKYPKGLCCHQYNDFFGTLRGMVFDPNNGIVDVCFGSTALNDWHTFKISNPEKYQEFVASIQYEETPINFYNME